MTGTRLHTVRAARPRVLEVATTRSRQVHGADRTSPTSRSGRLTGAPTGCKELTTDTFAVGRPGSPVDTGEGTDFPPESGSRQLQDWPRTPSAPTPGQSIGTSATGAPGRRTLTRRASSPVPDRRRLALLTGSHRLRPARHRAPARPRFDSLTWGYSGRVARLTPTGTAAGPSQQRKRCGPSRDHR